MYSAWVMSTWGTTAYKVVSGLGQRLRRCPNAETTLCVRSLMLYLWLISMVLQQQIALLILDLKEIWIDSWIALIPACCVPLKRWLRKQCLQMSSCWHVVLLTADHFRNPPQLSVCSIVVFAYLLALTCAKGSEGGVYLCHECPTFLLIF